MNSNLKTNNPFTQEISYFISDKDFEKWICNIFNLKSFTITEVSNNSSLNIYLPKRDKEEYRESEWWTKYGSKEAQEILNKPECPEWDISTLFDYLWLEGYLEPGQYYIHVNW